ncbi:MAG: hypothetical protein LBR39_07405 [Coriobacteriales bacterium]|nr:hypothetical protein [Coriobacteriales bacterium]
MSAQKSARKASGGSKSAGKKASASASRGGRAAKGSSGSGSGSGSSSRGAAAAATQESPGLLNEDLRTELIGVFIAILALALLIAVLVPTDALIASAVSGFLRLALGLGAFILPFLLLIWAASFFIKTSLATSARRLSAGLIIIFVGALAIIALFTAGASGSNGDPGAILAPEALRSHGGYIGGAIAWGLLETVGFGIAMVLLVGAIIVGAILTGFSISGLVERISRLFQRNDPELDALNMSVYDLGGGSAGAGNAGNGNANANGKAGVRRKSSRRGFGELVAPTEALGGETDENAAADGAGGLLASGAGALGATRRLLARKGKAGQGDQAVDPNDPANIATVALDGEGREGQEGLDGQDGQDGRKGIKNSKATSRKAATGANGSAAGGQQPGILSEDFRLPSINLLKVSRSKATTKAGEKYLRDTAEVLQATLDEFQLDGTVVGWTAGPTITLFKVKLGEGVRLARINSLADDIALALAAPSVRIFSPIPGTTLVGVEVPNAERSDVLLGDVLPDAGGGLLEMAIGKDVEGESIIADLAKMPHLLIGGTTGSGKSVAINGMIVSILMRATPEQVRMILIDPKMVELTLYNDIPHLYVPVVTDAQKAAAALNWGVVEMERRLKVFSKAGAKNISQYNEYVRKERQKAQRELDKAAAKAAQLSILEEAEGLFDEQDEWAETDGGSDGGNGSANAATGQADPSTQSAQSAQTAQSANSLPADLPEHMPLIVIVIDELADLMMAAGKDVESSITRIAQLARAAGLHLIIATQRPSTNVITGLIKANIVNRIALTVASGIDSRVILDAPGAEKLTGHGDMLFMKPEYGKPPRIQGCYVSEAEISSVVDFLKAQGEPEYHEEILATALSGISSGMLAADAGADDPLTWEAAEIVVSTQLGSTSTLQRRLSVGYARAGRIMDILEQKGIVGPPNGSKPREVMIDDVLELESLKALEMGDISEDW